MMSYFLVLLHIYYVLRTSLYFWLWYSASSFKYKFIKTSKRKSLPIYTILAPMYREHNIVKQLINNLNNINYPKDKLQIICLVEDDDIKVITAVSNEILNHPKLWIELIICPAPKKNQNKTKPRALNFALNDIKGEFVVVYDAEDEPEIDQLKKAVRIFDKTDYSCLQACLNYRNHKENWLARMFSTEYSIWFDWLIPGLAHHNMPIPLGGTSNHFRTEVIKKLKGWDPNNVTEDCEIGLRMYALGMKVGWLQSTTWEEACHRTWPWIKQRTRWIKGYMYTWLYSKNVPKGFKALISWHLFVLGTPLVTLINPLMWGLTTLWLLNYDISVFFNEDWMWKFAWFCMLFGNILHITMCIAASLFRNRKFNALLCITFPIYWLLMSVAGIRALYELWVNPTYWSKTSHGVSKRDDRKKVNA